MTKKFVPLDNVSDDINFNMMQSEKDGGIWARDISEGETIHVQTQNTLYSITNRADCDFLQMKGHVEYCPDWVQVLIHGSTWGGAMLKVGFIGVGMNLEVTIQGHGVITTSEIKSVKVAK